MSIEPPNPQQMDPTLALIMQLFGGVPQQTQFDEDGEYQDPMDPLNDALDTTQNLYSTLGFNLQDLILPPAPPKQWINDVGEAYGASPLYGMIFADIEDGADPITAVQNVMRAATPTDAQGNPLEPGDKNIARYVVQDPDSGELLDVPTKIWNQNDGMGSSTPQIQLDLDAIQGVAKDYATSMAEGRRFQAEQPDMGVYTALDEAGGTERIDALKSAYATQNLRESLAQGSRINPDRVVGAGAAPMSKQQANRIAGYRGSEPRPDESRTKGRRGYRGSEPQAASEVRQGGGMPRDRRNDRMKANAEGSEAAYNKRMDQLVAKNGGRVARVGKDRQRQLDALSAVLALPQIINGR